MNTNSTNQSRSATIITIVLMVTAIPSAAVFGYFGYTGGLPGLYIPAATLIVTSLIDAFLLTAIRRGHINATMLAIGAMFTINVLTVLFVVQGLGFIIAASILVVITSIFGLAIKGNYSLAGVITAFVLGAIAIFLDISISYERVTIELLQTYSLYITVVIAAAILVILLREARRFSLQAKITLGILLTGGATIIALLYFGLDRASLIINNISGRYENNIDAQNQNKILLAILEEANFANQFFEETASDALQVAKYLESLDSQPELFSSSSYWNAQEKVFQLTGGQYGNSGVDTASIFIPNTYQLTDDIVNDLNKNIFLDFVAPGFLDTHPQVTAIYYISARGYTIYYPNIGLANAVPADFDPTREPFYTVAAPFNNPDRLPRWTTPYQDPAGTGLIVTLSIPVYSEDEVFRGVVGVDIQLSVIADSISAIKFGQSGFSILLDENGLILAMPEEGYELFELEPEVIPVNESPKQNIFGRGPDEIQVITADILSGDTNLRVIRPDDVETYVAYTPLEATGYRLAVIAPVNELNVEVVAAREELQNEIDTTLQGAVFILTAMLFGALLISIWIGQVITRPLKQLTSTVQQISVGDLSARVQISSSDETGVLAESFNTMAQTLNETLVNLEDRIRERTAEVERVSQSNAYRAAQFEAIARISRTISSTQSLGDLLPQIAETISDQLGFYHTGIFLLDGQKEYANLVAANSEGGKRMLARNHRLRVGETGIVGYATGHGEPRIALDVGQDAVFFNNPDLPNTRSEVALPLRVGNEVIGALDVQSTESNAFSQEDVNILSTLADQVAIAIQNARSYQQSIEALQQAEQIAAQLSEQQWRKFIAEQPVRGYQFDGVQVRDVQEAATREASSIAIPLVLRGTRIGTLKLSAPDSSRVWDDDELAMAQAAAERTAFALENARLLLEAQKRASKERTIGEISAKIGNLVSLENILQTAIQELGNTLPGTNVAIQFTSSNPNGGAAQENDHV